MHQMAWSDDSDAPALRLRTWPVRNAETLDAEPVEYEGVLPKRVRRGAPDRIAMNGGL